MTTNGVLSPVILQHEEKRTLIIYVLYGEAPPWGPTPSPFINTRLLTEKGALFYTFQTAVNALSLKYEETENQTVFFDFFTDKKCICNPFRAFLHTEKTWFPYPDLSYGSDNKWNPYLFYLKPEKGSLLGRSLPVQTNVGSFPQVLCKNC